MNPEYQRLDTRIQKWVFKQGWSDLRDIQKKSIAPILAGNQDVLISASTAAGKTEAFFLPACSAIANNDDGFGILYISPLKALINDQYRRLESLCDMLDMRLTPWHGDSSQSKKKQAKKDPSGILLITPESLESLLIRDPGWVKRAFLPLQHIVIDEFHAFIGAERGQQLLSLLNRLEHLLDRQDDPIPRTALSATLGKIETVPKSLRPNQSLPCTTICDINNQSTLKLQVKGYTEPLGLELNCESISAEDKICEELYEICRGDSHLVFVNSRKRTEGIAAKLADLCEKNTVPNEFFPHHGSLSKDLRETLEERLQKESLPTTAVCTMTLELGIDIGKVNSVVQVTAPHSVSSLRQRLGRSGRRGDPAVLRMLIPEYELNVNSNIVDKLRIELLQSIAMIRLLISGKWFEPADTRQYHFSTLLHQIVAITAQWGGVRADQLYALLCQTGPFQHITVDQFKQILTHMGDNDLLVQPSSGELVLGVEGERLVNHYTFYAVFKTPEEFRIIAKGETLGSLPVDTVILEGQYIIFSGRRWKVSQIDGDKKVIYVAAAKGGKPPKFGGNGMSVHDVVRKEMYKIYSEGEYRIASKDFLDNMAKELFREGVTYFQQVNLGAEILIQQGKCAYLIPWMGDKIVNTLVILLIQLGYKASAYAGVIEIENEKVADIRKSLAQLALTNLPSNTDLAFLIPKKEIDKYDELLPDTLWRVGYGQMAFDIDGAKDWLLKQKSQGLIP